MEYGCVQHLLRVTETIVLLLSNKSMCFGMGIDRTLIVSVSATIKKESHFDMVLSQMCPLPQTY